MIHDDVILWNTGPLWNRWISFTEDQLSSDVFFVLNHNQLLNRQLSCRWFVTHWHQCDDTMMCFMFFRLGRKRSLALMLMCNVAACVAATFSVNLYMFVAARFLVAACGVNCLSLGYVLGKPTRVAIFYITYMLLMRESWSIVAIVCGGRRPALL